MPAQFFHSLSGIAGLSQYQVVRRAGRLQVSVVVNRDDARSEVRRALKTALNSPGASDFRSGGAPGRHHRSSRSGAARSS